MEEIFEYKILSTSDLKRMSSKNYNYYPMIVIEDSLKQLGKEGWKLIQIDTTFENQRKEYYFMRKVQIKEPEEKFKKI